MTSVVRCAILRPVPLRNPTDYERTHVKLSRTLAATAGVTLAVAALALVAGTANATVTLANVCTTVKHGDLTGVTQEGKPAVSLTIDGVEVNDATDADMAYWSGKLAVPAPLLDVRELTYRAYKYDTGKAEYSDVVMDVVLSLPGGKTAAIHFEPYWQGNGALVKPPTGKWMLYNAVDGNSGNGGGKWWTSSPDVHGMTPESGGGEHNATWKQIAAANPAAAVTAVGWGVYNAGTHAAVNDVKVKTSVVCTVDNWSTNNPKPTTTPTAKPTVTPTAVPTTVAPVVLPTPTRSTTPAASSSLPVTGSSTGLLVGAAVLLLAAGGGLFVVARRRRMRFTA